MRIDTFTNLKYNLTNKYIQKYQFSYLLLLLLMYYYHFYDFRNNKDTMS